LLVEQLQRDWRARRIPQNLQETPSFKAGHLELGAHTVLAKTDASASGDDDRRLTALLSVAYGPTVAAGALGHVRAAIARRRAGDPTAADLHLALSRLDRLRHPEDASRRLFMADGLMRGGVSPEEIMEVLQEGAVGGAGVSKYSPDQPRVPAGSGRPSGQWSGGADAASALPDQPSDHTSSTVSEANAPASAPTPAAQAATGDAVDATYVSPAPAAAELPSLSELSAGAADALGDFIAGVVGIEAAPAIITVGGAVAVFSLAFIPTNKGPQGQWVTLGGPGNLSYYQNPDELQIRLKYTTPDGVQHVERASPGLDGEIRTPDSRVVGRIVKVGAGTAIVVSTAALGIDPTNEPQLCPAYRPDRNKNSLGRIYEDLMKKGFNPLNPTPSGMAYYFYDPQSGKFPAIDDCQQQTGALAEYKGPGYEEHWLKKDIPWKGMLSDILSQSKAQASAAGERPITWYFAEEGMAEYFKLEFPKLGEGREKIRVEWAPMPGGRR
jgi:hypothetical protein